MRVLSHLPAVIGFLALPALCGGMDAVSPKVPGSGCHAHVVVPLALLMAFPVIAAAFRSLAEVSRRFARRASVPAFSASVLFLLLYAVPAHDVIAGTVSVEMVGVRNWSGGEGVGYYPAGRLYSQVMYSVLMHNHFNCVIPLGFLKATIKDSGGMQGEVSVGLDQMSTREPIH